jgi:hypothetical protein
MKILVHNQGLSTPQLKDLLIVELIELKMTESMELKEIKISESKDLQMSEIAPQIHLKILSPIAPAMLNQAQLLTAELKQEKV